MNVQDALANLDPDNDAHWTANGLPRMDVMQTLTHNEALTRQAVIDADPNFTREGVKMAEEAEEASEPGSVDRSCPVPDPEAAPAEPMPVMVEAADPNAAVPHSDEEVAEATPTEVPPPEAPLSTVERLRLLSAEKTIEMTQAYKDAEAAKKHADKLANDTLAIDQEIARLTPHDPKAATAGIKPYIAMQNKLRIEKAQRLNEFIIATGGAKPGDLRKALDVRSALDQAMQGRKPARGARRPAVRGTVAK